MKALRVKNAVYKRILLACVSVSAQSLPVFRAAYDQRCTQVQTRQAQSCDSFLRREFIH